MLTFILAEAAIERVPPEIAESREARKHAGKRRKKPEETLLDRSYHYPAITSLPNQEKRGRPDIAHFNLLQLLGSPLNKEGLLKIYVHTIDNSVISVNPQTRIPRNYDRFVGLMEQLLDEKRVPPKGEALMKLKRMNFPEMCSTLKLGYLIGLSTSGDSSTSERVASRLAAEDKPGVVIGGFPRGHFSSEVERCFNELVSIDKEALDSWIVASRIVYDYERILGMPEKRR